MISIREKLKINGSILMYVGNLETYQGIDLLLESFSIALEKSRNVHLVIFGGNPQDIKKYQAKAVSFEISHNVHFMGSCAIEQLGLYLKQADILVSPRIQGDNTPMKIYSYLDSGKALLATNLPTHTQVLNGRVALLANPLPQDFSDGILHLLSDSTLRQNLGHEARMLVKQHHTYEAFSEKLNSLYDWLQVKLCCSLSESVFEADYL